MAEIRGRFINTAIWRDDWFLGLRESEQHLFMYLVTGPATSLCGVYQLGLMEAAFHTKIDQQEIKRIFSERFAKDGKAFFEVGYVVLKNHLKHQRFNPNQWKAVATEINQLPEWLRKDLFDEQKAIYLPFESLTNGILTVPKGSLTVAEHFEQDKIKLSKDKLRQDKGKLRPAADGGNGQAGGAGTPDFVEIPYSEEEK